MRVSIKAQETLDFYFAIVLFSSVLYSASNNNVRCRKMMTVAKHICEFVFLESALNEYIQVVHVFSISKTIGAGHQKIWGAGIQMKAFS